MRHVRDSCGSGGRVQAEELSVLPGEGTVFSLHDSKLDPIALVVLYCF